MEKSKKGTLHKVFKPGYNIESKVRKDEVSAEFEQYDRKMKTIGIITDWHENKQKYAVCHGNLRTEKAITEELISANVELKIRRKARLKQLYQAEMAKYEAELNEMGLAVYRDRLQKNA